MSNFRDVYEAQKNAAADGNSYDASLALAKVYHKRYEAFAASGNPLAAPYLDLTAAEYNRAGQLNNSSPEPWQRRGDLYAQAKKWDEAAADYQQALSRQESGVVRFKLAQAYFERGSSMEAQQEAQTALKGNAQCGECAELLGKIEEKNGNTEGAFKFYQLALQKKPGLAHAQLKVNEITDAKTPKGFIKVAIVEGASSEQMWGFSDVDSQSQAGVGVSAGSWGSSGSSSHNSSGSARGSYDTSDYGSGSAEVSGESSGSSSYEGGGSASSMSGTMMVNTYACQPSDIQIIAYNRETRRQYNIEKDVRTPLPIGQYVLYASFLAHCEKQFGDPYKAKQKTEWKKTFSVATGQYFNLEMLMKAGMLEKECFIDVRPKKEKFDVD